MHPHRSMQKDFLYLWLNGPFNRNIFCYLTPPAIYKTNNGEVHPKQGKKKTFQFFQTSVFSNFLFISSKTRKRKRAPGRASTSYKGGLLLHGVYPHLAIFKDLETVGAIAFYRLTRGKKKTFDTPKFNPKKQNGFLKWPIRLKVGGTWLILTSFSRLWYSPGVYKPGTTKQRQFGYPIQHQDEVSGKYTVYCIQYQWILQQWIYISFTWILVFTKRFFFRFGVQIDWIRKWDFNDSRQSPELIYRKCGYIKLLWSRKLYNLSSN